MRGLEAFWSQHDRVWVTDFNQDTEVIAEREAVYWLPYQAPRNYWSLLSNMPAAFRILLRERPDLVVSTGASIAINFAIASKILGRRFMFIESISRSKELSLSGKIVYPLADEFYVQWDYLANKYRKAVFKGIVA